MVTLIGMGSGKWEALSAQAQQAVRSAGLVFGAKRLLVGLPPECTARQFALYQPADILETLAQNSGQDAAVLYSGDTGFYSGASGLLTPLRALGIPARVYPGVSSIQMLSAALGRPWQDWKLVSAHGCACDPVAECMMNRSVFFLTGGTETPASLCQKLTDAGMGEAHGVVGENLGTEAEAIRYGSAAELAGQSFAPLSVLLVENFDLPQLLPVPAPDDDKLLIPMQLVNTIIGIEEELADLTKIQKDYKAKLKTAMRENGVKSWDAGRLRVSYTPASTSDNFDTKKFQADYPELYSKYIKTVPKADSIRVTIREDKS